MRRTIPLLTVILALQIGLAALLAVRKDPLAATTPQTPLINASLQSVDHVLIEGHTTGATGATGATGTAGAAGGAGATGPAGTTTGLATVELAKQDGKWVLPGYFNAPVDKFKLNDVLDELSDLKRGLPVATSSSALERFKLVDDNFERRLTLSAGKKVLSTVYFGSSAGVRKTDARTSRDHAVYNVDLATYELPTQPSDWFDAGILEGDINALSQMDVTPTGQPTIELLRQTHQAAPAPTATTASSGAAGTAATSGAAATPATASNPVPAATTAAATAGAAGTSGTGVKVWVDPSLPQGRQVDGAHVDALAQDIANLRVDGILGLAAQPQWQQDHPLLTLALHDDKHPDQIDTWTISQPADTGAAASVGSPTSSASSAGRTERHSTGKSPGSKGAGASGASTAVAKASAPAYYVLKASAHPWYFKLSAATGKQLLDASASTLLLTAAQTTTGKPSAHTNSDAHGAGRAHRGQRGQRGQRGTHGT
jgi:Domain of unknown function (DUF4340)